MDINEIGENTERKGPICPFLGLKDDPTTALSFPSAGNHCYHAKPVSQVKLDHQVMYCLTAKHASCEEFIRTPDNPLPPAIRLERGGRQSRRSTGAGIWVFLLVVFIVILVAWQFFAKGLVKIGNPKSGSNTLIVATQTGTAIISSMDGPSPETPTLTPVLTMSPASPTPTPPPVNNLPTALETPMGPGNKLVIHKVVSGESLTSIAANYWTTPDAIQAVNYHLPIPLMIDWLVIIPKDQVDVSALPAFEPYNVQSDIAVEKLAQQLTVDSAQMILYNNLQVGQILKAGEWVLIPHSTGNIP